jgi:hypothetical protein
MSAALQQWLTPGSGQIPAAMAYASMAYLLQKWLGFWPNTCSNRHMLPWIPAAKIANSWGAGQTPAALATIEAVAYVQPPNASAAMANYLGSTKSN